MNKFMFLMFLMFIVLFITLVANSIDTYAITDGINDNINTSITNNRISILSFLDTYLKLLTFQIPNFPPILNVFFIPLNLVMGYYIIDVVKDLVPFT